MMMVKIQFVWVVTLCRLAYIYRRFQGACLLNFGPLGTENEHTTLLRNVSKYLLVDMA